MKPPSPYKTIDTLKAARKHFQFESSRLNDLGQYLGFGKKLPTTGFDLWERVMQGDLKAWHLMKRYNQRDVVLLEKVYMEFRPWMTTHPNLGIFKAPQSKIPCPNCGSHDVRNKGSYTTSTRRYKQYGCRNCGHWFKGEFVCSLLTPEGLKIHETMLAAKRERGAPCPECGSSNTWRHARETLRDGSKVKVFKCKNCARRFR
jgi:predicted RNA-binding Zn-ribbon protein involved in translation (DUF1610 family)